MKLLRRNPFSNNITYTGEYYGKKSIIKVGDKKIKDEYDHLKLFEDKGHFPEVYDFKQEDDEYTLTMQFLEGRAMTDIIQLEKDWSSNELDVYSVKALYPKLLKVIDVIHKEDFLYRDFNFEHFFLIEDKMYAVDLDCLIKRNKDKKFISDSHTGTWETMAPEEFEEEFGSELGFYTNVYSLGIMLYQLLYGKSPLKMQNFGVGVTKPEKAEQYNFHKTKEIEFPTEENKSLNNVIRKATSKDPAKRYQTVEQLAEAFLGCYA